MIKNVIKAVTNYKRTVTKIFSGLFTIFSIANLKLKFISRVGLTEQTLTNVVIL